MIETIRVGQTRNLLRALSSLLEMWPRSAHHHPGQRRLVSRMNRPDKRTHSITCHEDQKILANRAASTKEGWTSDPSPPPLALAKAFSRSGRGRIFAFYSRVMRVGLSTDPVASGCRRARPVPHHHASRQTVGDCHLPRGRVPLGAVLPRPDRGSADRDGPSDLRLLSPETFLTANAPKTRRESGLLHGRRDCRGHAKRLASINLEKRRLINSGLISRFSVN